MSTDILDRLDGLDTGWRKLGESVTDKDYRTIVSFANCTSYSQLQSLHKCPRMYQLDKAAAQQSGQAEGFELQENIDFAFGHSVGAGVATFIVTQNLTAGLFASWLAWKADYFGIKEKQDKSLAWAQFAIEKWREQNLLEDYEVYTFEDGTPAVEVAFVVRTEQGFQHYGHIDILLRHKPTGRVCVGEFKTTGYESVDEATYANSSQGVGYGVVLDSIAPGNADYEVLYCVYSSKAKEWQLMPFNKSQTEKAAWLQDLLLDHSNIRTYQHLNFFPKRGESCANQFGRRCRYFGTCDLTSHATQYPELPSERTAENVHFSFSLTDIIEQQRRLTGL